MEQKTKKEKHAPVKTLTEIIEVEQKVENTKQPDTKLLNKSLAYSMFKENLGVKPPLLLSLIGFFISLFVIMSAISIKAQAGFVVVALVIFAIYVILVGIFALLLSLVSLLNACK